MISLTIAALTFVVGLNIYVYVSAQVRQVNDCRGNFNLAFIIYDRLILCQG